MDAKLRVTMRAELKDLHERLGTTMIYVTHDQVEAMTMVDKIVVMSDGNVEQIGTPLDLYDYPISVQDRRWSMADAIQRSWFLWVPLVVMICFGIAYFAQLRSQS